MRIPQLSLTVLNKPGQLFAPCDLLANAGINIVTLSLADRKDFGILRLIVREWQRAKEVLEAVGLTVTMTEVLAIEVRDEPGGLVGCCRSSIGRESMWNTCTPSPPASA